MNANVGSGSKVVVSDRMVKVVFFTRSSVILTVVKSRVQKFGVQITGCTG